VSYETSFFKRLLWVDAVWINQLDEDERALQVQRMGENHSKAMGVGVWLGEEDSNSTRAMELISGISFLRDTPHDAWWTAQRVSAFSGLLTRPCFQKGWVVQKVAFSAKMILFCGNREVGWEDLEFSIKFVAALYDKKLRNRAWVPIEHSRSRDFYMKSWLRTRDHFPFGDLRQRASYRLHGTSLVEDSEHRTCRLVRAGF
jgi:hypothetical protein